MKIVMVATDLSAHLTEGQAVVEHVGVQEFTKSHVSTVNQAARYCNMKVAGVKVGMRLKDRGKLPPGGLRYYVPQTNFSITPWVSFDAAVEQIRQHRVANPYKCQQHGWSTDPAVIAGELDAWNTNVCVQMGWMDWVTDGQPENYFPPPKALTPQSGLSRSAQLAVGARTIADWEIAGGQVVPHELSNARAKTCSNCIKNEPGDLSTWFTEAAAHVIRLQLETRNKMKLRTDFDPLLGICTACFCPTKLKVHAPLDIILKHLKPEIKAALASQCWILNEK